MDFMFEKYRDNPDIERQVQIALDLWDANAHLLTCESDPKSPRFKVPTMAKWQERRNTRDEIEAWVRAGKFIGIMAPSLSLGITCVDIDNGVEYRTQAVEKLGKPIVAHESSRSKPGKCHCWYFTPIGTTKSKWAGGDIRSESNHQVLLYNLEAVYMAWEIAKAGNAQDVNIEDLPMAAKKSILERSQDLLIEKDHKGEPLPEDIQVADAAIPESHRHDTMIAKIGRAVMQCATKAELRQRVTIITDAHRKALADEEDPIRKAGIQTEIAGAKAFAEGAWAKRGAQKKLDREIWAACRAYPTIDAATEALMPAIEAFAKLCEENDWPTWDRAKDDMIEAVERAWRHREEREEQANALIRHREEADARANALAEAAREEGRDFSFAVESGWGTKQSWIEAVEKLGIKFRYNTFVEQGDVWVPESLLAKDLGGGQWTQLDDNLRAVISVLVERHATAPAQSGKNIVNKPVELGRNKEIMARDYLFAMNRWCPMRSYFESLPPWCGEHIIHNSMERGGMMVDAGPFTAAAQAFLWLFTVRNCLFPGSGMREYIVLYGDHDCGKSKFVELALPPHLKQYYNGGFSLDGSLKVKLERSVGKALLECGEMGQGGAKDWNAVKQWLTLSEVSGERMAYKEFAKRHKLTATTIFTTNHPELPPTDDAVLSRFIWVKVKTRATRAKDISGNEIELVWQHFDQLYDIKRPELGTWREQYFAQALAIVKGSVRKTEYMENDSQHTRLECNPQWLPPGSKSELVEWNKQAGSTYTTEQSSLVDDLELAIQTLAEEFRYENLEGFYPNPELKAALAAIEDGTQFESWFDIVKSASGSISDTIESRKMERVRRVATTKSTANALRQAASRLGLEVSQATRRWVPGGGNMVRGWLARKIGESQ